MVDSGVPESIAIDHIRHEKKPLRKILKAHHEWVLSDGRKGTQADLCGAGLNHVDLKGVDLARAQMKGAHLWAAHLGRADLAGANLSQTDLCHADLRGAILKDANLQGADISEADLSQSDLSGANLSGTDLVRANLSGARLVGTNMQACVFGCTIVAGCDFGSVKGVETIEHVAPSSLGVDSILKMQGNMAEVFLKGIGIPDLLIASIKALAKNPLQFHTCFIRHSRKDMEFAERLCADLRMHGARCWHFPEMTPQGRFQGDGMQTICEYDKIIVVCSKHSLHGELLGEAYLDDVCDEIKRAVQREEHDEGDILFPIMIDSYLTGEWKHKELEEEHKARLLSRLVADFSDANKYQESLDKLLKALGR